MVFRSWLLTLLMLCLTPFRLPAQTISEKPALYLLVIGVNEYEDPGITDLKFAVSDAEGMLAWAEAQAGHLYGEVYTRKLLNQDATRAEIIQQIREFFRPAAPTDQLVLFISGHGLIDRDSQHYYFMDHKTDVANIAGTALEQDDILEKLDNQTHPRRRVLVLTDTCHAGALAEAFDDGKKGFAVEQDVKAMSDREADRKANLWAIFSAGTAQDLAGEDARWRLPGEPDSAPGHGLFTYALLLALSTMAADSDHNGVVTLTEFQQFVTRTVRELSKGSQFPVMSGKLMDVALSFAPGTEERCDGVDNNLDGEIDEGFPDQNLNGVPDCLDQEICNGIDDNGNGQVDEGFDLDRDGYNSMQLCGSIHGTDCDDTEISIHPGQKDWGNLRDDDCDGLIDEDDFDRDCDCIPDGIEKEFEALQQKSRRATGLAILLNLGAGASYAALYSTAEAARQSGDEISDAQRGAFLGLSAGFYTLTGAGLAGDGLAISALVKQRRFKEKYFPRGRCPRLELRKTRPELCSGLDVEGMAELPPLPGAFTPPAELGTRDSAKSVPEGTPEPELESTPAPAPSDAPESTQVPAPADAPESTPEPAPADAPTPAPVDVPADAPERTPTPSDAPADAPAPAPADAPESTPTPAPAEAPADTPVPTPADAPTPAPVDVPADAPESTPVPEDMPLPEEQPRGSAAEPDSLLLTPPPVGHDETEQGVPASSPDQDAPPLQGEPLP